MNVHQRRRKLMEAINIIEELIADVLEEASDLNRPQILERVGWPRHLEGNDRAWEAIGHFLLVMEDNGEIVNNNPGHGQDRWSKAQSG